jgi:hypothetical protein
MACYLRNTQTNELPFFMFLQLHSMNYVLNLGALFLLLFVVSSALAIELFGRIECTVAHPCAGLSDHVNFHHIGMAVLTLFRISTGDNWNGILDDTMRSPPEVINDIF